MYPSRWTKILMLIAATLLTAEPAVSSASSRTAFSRGSENPREIASFSSVRLSRRGLSSGPLLQEASADTSAAPVWEQEEEEKHLARDIAIFVIVSAFVGYFIAKVFIEGEKEEPPADKGGKQIPVQALKTR